MPQYVLLLPRNSFAIIVHKVSGGLGFRSTVDLQSIVRREVEEGKQKRAGGLPQLPLPQHYL